LRWIWFMCIIFIKIYEFCIWIYTIFIIFSIFFWNLCIIKLLFFLMLLSLFYIGHVDIWKKNQVMSIGNSSLFIFPLVTLVFEAFALCWGCLGKIK
jgi:hypothetical protein